MMKNCLIPGNTLNLQNCFNNVGGTDLLSCFDNIAKLYFNDQPSSNNVFLLTSQEAIIFFLLQLQGTHLV